MAKRTLEVNTVISRLIMNKEELKQRLEKRIGLGKELLELNVKVISVNLYARTQNVKYDDAEKTEFFSAFTKWDNFNIELLKHAFNYGENEYKKEYENSYHMAGMFGSDDVVADQKKTIKKK